MRKEVVKVRIDQNMKDKYKKYTDQIGITMSEDILLHIQQCIKNQNYNTVCEQNDIHKNIYQSFLNIYSILDDADFCGVKELIKELEDLECHLLNA